MSPEAKQGAGAQSAMPASTREALVSAGVLLGSLAIHAAAWVQWRTHELAAQPFMDAGFYFDLASGAADPSPGPLLWHPLYPAFLKAVFAAFGRSVHAAIAVQVCLGALGAELAYLAGRRAFKSSASGLACAALAAFYAPFLVYEGLLLSASLAVFLVWVFAWSSVCARESGMRVHFALAGAAVGLAGLSHPTLLAALPPVAAWAAIRRERAGKGLDLVSAAVFLTAAALPLVPPFAHNAAHGVLSPLPAHGGFNFYIGNRQGATGRYERPFGGPQGLLGQRAAALAEASARAGAELSPAEADRFWLGEGFREILCDKASWATLTGKKALLLLNDYEVPLDYNPEFIRSQSPLLSAPLPTFGLVLALAAAGTVFAVLDRRMPWQILLFFAAGFAVAALFFVSARYRLPLVPPLVILAGHGAARLLRSALTLQLASFSAAAAAAVAAAADALIPAERSDFSGSMRMIGDARRERGMIAKAIEAYDESIAVRETSAAWNNRGNALLAFNDPSRTAEAVRSFRRAIELDGANREARNNLGVALKRSGDLFGAEQAFSEAIEAFPGYAKPVENLARLYEEAGDEEAARELRGMLKKKHR